MKEQNKLCRSGFSGNFLYQFMPLSACRSPAAGGDTFPAELSSERLLSNQNTTVLFAR
jgi:hypothetical protein